MGTAALIIPNEEIEDIVKIVKALEESDLLIKSAGETIQSEAKEEEKRIFLGIFLGHNLWRNMLPDKGVIWSGEEIIRAGQDFYYRLIIWIILNTKILTK